MTRVGRGLARCQIGTGICTEILLGIGTEILLRIWRLRICLGIRRGKGIFLLVLHARFAVFLHMQ
jgi:hypothetical protein